MSHATPYSYERAPIEVKTRPRRDMSFEVGADGEVLVTVEVDDYGTWRGSTTMEVEFYVTAEDWRAIVAHIERDLPASSTDDEKST